MKPTRFTRCLALLLVAATLAGFLLLPASAEEPPASETLAGASTVTLKYNSTGLRILNKSTGGTYGGGCYTYTTNTGLQGPGYCVNYDLHGVSSTKSLPVHKYDRSPKTMGAISNGYPQRTLEQFKELHKDIDGIANLTQDEYAYATQVAVWASCGQIAVPDTTFTAGRSSIVKPTADAQQKRVFEAVKAILKLADGWTRHIYSGVYLRAEKEANIRGVEIIHPEGLAGAADAGADGVKNETINGVDYYTRVAYVASATSPWISDYKMEVFSTNAPVGTIFVAENNASLETGKQDGVTSYKVDISAKQKTSFNANGSEYYGAFKVCIPIDKAADEGSFQIRCRGQVAQFQLYIADNPTTWEQSYIIADPAYVTLGSSMPFKWSKTANVPETASLQVVKTGDGGEPLEGAEFTLTSTSGKSYHGITKRDGQIIWEDLPAGERYTLSETKAPEGYRIVDPVNITLTAGRTSFLTVKDSTENCFRIKKVDGQNNASLEGAVFRFEQIDGKFVTTGTTGFDGVIEFQGDDLPYGSYRVTEQNPPEGYVKSDRVETVHWDGTRDVTITWENDRDIGLIIVKVDEQTGVSLPNAAFDVYADGKFLTSVITNNAGEARVTGIKKEAYISVVETASPAGYVLDRVSHGVHIDPYDPTIEDDPVLVVTNRARPALRILKYDQQSNAPMPNVTFEIRKDEALLGQYTTNGEGEIYLYDLDPGTYFVKEIASDADHVVNSTPQQIELEEGQTQTYELIFFNQLKPGIHLVKVDSQTMKSLPNAKFEFKLVGGTYRQEFTTDANGEIDLSRLTPGTYEVTEIQAPKGYLIDDAVRVIKVDPDENANFVFTDTRKPAFRLIKKSSDGTALPGVHFRIAKIEDGTHYLDRITDDKGEINISDLEPGVYSVRETATVSDHVLDLQEYHVELFPGQTSTITIENQKRPNLTVVKRDAVTGEPIPDTVFIVRAADGHSVDEIKTGADGKATLENLLPGVYEVSEKSVPSAYLKDAPSQLVTLYANRNHTVYFENHKKPSLTIRKVDSVTGEVIKGAEFSVWYGSNQTVTGELNDLGLHQTDENGLVELTGLSDGWYKVKEVEAAPGYEIKEPGEQSFYIQGSENKLVTFENIPLSAIVIWKFDRVTNEPISGARFVLKYLGAQSGTGGTIIGDYFTGPSGGVTITGLKKGYYVVEELASDTHHVVDSAPQAVSLIGNSQDVIQVYFGNTPKGSVLVKKIDAITHQPLSDVEFLVTDSNGAVIGENNGKFTTNASGSFTVSGLDPSITLVVKEVRARNGYILDDVPQTISVKPGKTVELEFRNQPLGSLLIRKVCSVNTSVTLANAEFEVKYSDGAAIGNANGIFRTNANGEILVTGLVPGRSVVVTETRAPDGFIKDSQSQTIEIKEGAAAVLTFHNQPKGAIVVQKRDAQTGAPLAGAEFRVATAAGCEVGLDGVIGTSTLTQNGVFTTDAEGEIRISNLAPGSYILNEIKAPAGYVIDTPITPVVVGKNGDTQTILIKNSKAGSLLIEKKDSVTGEPLQGVQFKITNANGEFVPDENGVISSNGLYYTDANGQILLKGVVGTLVVTEEKTIEGYVIDEATRSQTVVVNPNDTQHLTFYNTPKNTLVIQKYAMDDKIPLAGVKFSVTESDGSVVGNSNGLFITNEDGQAVVSNLTPGKTLIVREVETVAGYTLEAVPQTILVKEGDPLILIFGNKPLANLTLIKHDSKGQPLSGAQFLVTDQHGLPVGPYNGHYTTGTNGQVTVTGIQPDVAITVREEKAPAGYVLNTEPQTITVRSNEDNTLTFVNGKKGTLVIVKEDAATGKVLAGAEFQVTTSGGAFVGNLEGAVTSNGIFKTNASGEITISGLDPDSYVVKEVKAPEGYELDSTPVTVRVDANDTQTIRIKNTALNGVIIQKFEGETTTPIPNVTFLVTDTSGKPIGVNEGEFVTDKNGRIVIDGLTPGMSITAKEIKCPEQYVLDGTPKSVKITEGAAQILTFRNEKKVSLTLHKYKAGTTEPLAGVRFKVSVSDGSALANNGIFVSDTQGQVVIPNLTPGVVVTAQEIETVDGYDLDPYPQSITMLASGSNQNASAGGGQSLIFDNRPLANLTLIKLDAITKKPLAGAQFLVTDGSGAAVGETGGHVTTGENGQVTIYGIKPGLAITVKEEQAPAGYVLNVYPKNIVVQSGKDNSLTFENVPKNTLTIHKYIEGTDNEPLKGVTFKITDDNGSPVGNTNGEHVTDENGEIILSGLTPGATITAQEIKTVEGFVLNGAPKSIKIREGEAQNLTFTNKKAGSLVIQKKDKLTGAPLAGVEFELTYAKGGFVDNANGHLSSNGRYFTDEHGEIHISGIVGAIVVKEIKTIPGYTIDPATQTQTVTVNPEDTQTLVFYNVPGTTLVLQKEIAGTDHEPLAGVKFLVTDGNGTYLGPNKGEYVTDKNGQVRIDGLTPGVTITAKEIATAEGFILDGTPQSITIKEGEVQTLTFINHKRGVLLIQKKDKENGNPLAGVEFRVEAANNASNINGKSSGVYKTDANGEIRIEGAVGTFVVTETKTLPNYSMESGGQSQTVTVGADGTRTVVFYNIPDTSLTIHKYVDGTDNEPLKGVTFLVTDAKGQPVGKSNGEFVTDEKGSIFIDNIAPGTVVTVRETKTVDGYVLDGTPKTVEITEGEGHTLTFTNKKAGSLVIQKKDKLTNEPLAGVEFEVSYSKGGFVDNDNGHLSSKGLYTTDEHGEIHISGIIGTVVVKETRSIPGYVIDQATQTQTVTVNPAETQTLRFFNAPLCNLTVRKVDSKSGNALAGAEFMVTHQDGSPVGASNGHFTTGSDGTFTVTGLTPGESITVREEKAPAGYTLNQEPQTIVMKSGQNNTLTFKNEAKGMLILLKLDKNTNKPLQGVEFKITTSSGELVANEEGSVSSNGIYLTDENGEIRLTGLSPATYVVTETKAAKGYLLNTQPTTVEVKTNDTQTIRIYNTPMQGLTIQKYIEGSKNEPLAGVTFLITDSAGTPLGPKQGEYVTDRNGQILLTGLEPGMTITAKEVKTVNGFVLDGTPQSILIKEGEGQQLTFYNKRVGGVWIYKVNEDDRSIRIPNTTFEIHRMDQGLVDTVTTDKNGAVHVDLKAGDYYLLETKAAEGYQLSTAPTYFTVKDNEATEVWVTNKAFSGIVIHKIDSLSGEGIYDVKFLLYDSNKNPIGEYATDNEGYIYIDNATVSGKGRLYIRELEAAPGYELDKEYKTVYVKPGETIEIEWKNTPITGQIQVMKFAAETNPVTGTPAGAPLQGAVYEISDPRSNKVVDYITTDARGIAASKPLPLARYKIVEVTAPKYWQLDPTVFDETLEYPGQIIKVSAYDKPSNLGVTITKRGNAEALAGSQMRYDFTVANTSNVPLENFYWHDRIPTDASKAMMLTTGTYSARLNYRILYKTNRTANYQVLASNLSTGSNYSFSLNAIPVQAGEVVTDVYFDFGKVPVGFQSTASPTLTVVVSGSAANGYQLINRADVGGKYQGTWETGQATWLTIIRKLIPSAPLPKTGY